MWVIWFLNESLKKYLFWKILWLITNDLWYDRELYNQGKFGFMFLEIKVKKNSGKC